MSGGLRRYERRRPRFLLVARFRARVLRFRLAIFGASVVERRARRRFLVVARFRFRFAPGRIEAIYAFAAALPFLKRARFRVAFRARFRVAFRARFFLRGLSRKIVI